MKTTIATINLYLRTAKKLADGTYAIYLRCNFHGMYEVPTHYSVHEKHWDKKNQVVKKGCPNYAMINIEIQKLKNKAKVIIPKTLLDNETNMVLFQGG